MRSPTTTTRVMMPPPCCLQNEPGHGKTNSFRPTRGADPGHRGAVDAQALPNRPCRAWHSGRGTTLGTVEAPYPAHWEADVVLADGGTAHVRPFKPADADRLRAFYSRLSDESIYFRF